VLRIFDKTKKFDGKLTMTITCHFLDETSGSMALAPSFIVAILFDQYNIQVDNGSTVGYVKLSKQNDYRYRQQ